MEGGISVGVIFLFNDDDVDCVVECSRVDGVLSCRYGVVEVVYVLYCEEFGMRRYSVLCVFGGGECWGL